MTRALSPPARLVAVPVAELVDESQLFACEPYKATLAARVCLERQRLHGERFRLRFDFPAGELWVAPR